MNKYEIKGIVGEGAYGLVYQAKLKETGELGIYQQKTLLLIITFCVSVL
jgi:hypothetical protein